MKKSGFTVSNYSKDDFEGFALLYIEQYRLAGRLLSEQEVAEILKRPGFTPEKDLFIAKIDGRIVGYAHLTPEPEINRIHLRSWISPEYRRKGIAGAFLDRITRRAEELGLNAVHIGISRDDKTARTILPKLGYKYIRRYLELEIDTDRITGLDIDSACRGCRQLQPGEEEKLLELQNRAFSNHWGYNPNTLDMITYDINLNNRSPQDVVFACEEDLVTGYCWTEIYEVADSSGTGKRGVINMIGTEPEYRGKGIGKKVLLAALAYLRDNGVSTVSLEVDSENTVACELYSSIGFEERGGTLWYEKTLG